MSINQPLLILNASAGSGKTYNLVQEYLRLILHDKNPKKFKSILAMTFTNKAANEMKERILSALEILSKDSKEKNQKEISFLNDTAKNLQLDPLLIEERSKQILNRILHHYNAFSVMTIDKFTHRVIRSFAKELEVSVDFDVELDIKTLRKNVTDILFDNIGQNPELTNLMLRYARTNLSRDKSWNFNNQVFEFSNILFNEEAIDSIEKLKKLSSDDFLTIQKQIEVEQIKLEKFIINCAKDALTLVEKSGLAEDDFAGKSNSIVGYFKKIAQEKFNTQFESVKKNIANNNWINSSSKNGSAVEKIVPDLENYFNKLNDAKHGAFGQMTLNKEILENLNNLSLLNHLLSFVDEIKEEQNVLLISDFYRKIADIIVNEKIPFIFERMGNRYEHFLLDEFQDTSYLQWLNMIPLVHNSLSFGNRNLVVGDGKQAIYRWRNGVVEQFTLLPNKIYNPQNISSLNEAEPLFRKMGFKKPLKENYRSAPEIVSFNNAFFTSITKEIAPLHQYIYEDVKQNATQSHTGYVELFLKEKLSEDDELQHILNCISQSIERGFQFKDICILVRKNNVGATIADFLNKNQIKVVSPDSLFIKNDNYVKFVFNIMCSSALPFNRNYKLKALEYFARFVANSNAIELSKKYIENDVEQTSNKKKIEPTSIEEIIRKEGYELRSYFEFDNLYDYVSHVIQLFELDILNNTYLQFFLDSIHRFEKRQNTNLRDFIEWFKAKGSEQSIVSPEGENAVQIMTIHKAKGLQFPIVICPFFNWKFELERQIAWIQKNENGLPAYFVKLKKEMESSPVNETYNEEEAKNKLDHLNLLYVAFTRPETALFISADSSVSSGVVTWINTHLKHTMLVEKESGFHSYGSFNNNHNKELEHVNYYKIDEKLNSMPRPKISFKRGQQWSIDELDVKRNFGIQLHLVLSKLKRFEDLDDVIERLIIKSLIDNEHQNSIRESITNLFQDEHFASYFEYSSRNEAVIIDDVGNKHIPDKIITKQDELLVVDFKSGSPKNEDIEQVINYIDLLKKMGNKNVKGEVYYTQTNEVIKI